VHLTPRIEKLSAYACCWELRLSCFMLWGLAVQVECPSVTPSVVLEASGHVERFTDFMVQDVLTKDCHRADHLLEDALETALRDSAKAGLTPECIQVNLQSISGDCGGCSSLTTHKQWHPQACTAGFFSCWCPDPISNCLLDNVTAQHLPTTCPTVSRRRAQRWRPSASWTRRSWARRSRHGRSRRPRLATTSQHRSPSS
jgi:hypothetical protein